MNETQLIQWLAMAVGGLAGVLAKVALHRIKELEARVKHLEERAHAMQLEGALNNGRFLDRAGLKEILDEKLAPLRDSIRHITEWIEAQNGIPSVRPHL